MPAAPRRITPGGKTMDWPNPAPGPFAEREESTIVSQCLGCAEMWYGAKAQADARRHVQATKHPVDILITRRIKVSLA